jgi:PilZ domain
MRDRRKNFRVEWNSAAKIYDRNGQFAAFCIVRNFSNSGAKIVALEPETIPNEFILRISPRTRAQRCQVIRRLKDGLGVKFTESAKSAEELVLGRRQKSSSKRDERFPQWA